MDAAFGPSADTWTCAGTGFFRLFTGCWRRGHCLEQTGADLVESQSVTHEPFRPLGKRRGEADAGDVTSVLNHRVDRRSIPQADAGDDAFRSSNRFASRHALNTCVASSRRCSAEPALDDRKRIIRRSGSFTGGARPREAYRQMQPPVP